MRGVRGPGGTRPTYSVYAQKLVCVFPRIVIWWKFLNNLNFMSWVVDKGNPYQFVVGSSSLICCTATLYAGLSAVSSQLHSFLKSNESESGSRKLVVKNGLVVRCVN